MALTTALSTRREQWNWNGIRGEEILRFVAHVVPGKLELLLSRSDLKALGAMIDLRSDQLHLENLRTTLKLSTTPAGHCWAEPKQWSGNSGFPYEDTWGVKVLAEGERDGLQP